VEAEYCASEAEVDEAAARADEYRPTSFLYTRMLVKAPPQARLDAPEHGFVQVESETRFRLKKLAGAHQHFEAPNPRSGVARREVSGMSLGQGMETLTQTSSVKATSLASSDTLVGSHLRVIIALKTGKD
jgi:hypothetical protein